MNENQNKYPDECANTIAPKEMPKITRLLESIQVQINEISNAKHEIAITLHRLSDSNVPQDCHTPEQVYSDDVVGILSRFRDNISNIRRDLYGISDKLNTLI